MCERGFMRYGMKAMLIAGSISLLVACGAAPDISPPTVPGGSADATADAVDTAEVDTVNNVVNVGTRETGIAAQQVNEGADTTGGGVL